MYQNMSFEEEYKVGLRYRCEYNLFEEEQFWRADCKCKFIDWFPVFFPFDDVYRIPLGNFTIKNAFEVSKETLKEWDKPGMGAKEYYEKVAYLERYPVIEGFTISFNLYLDIFRSPDLKSFITKKEVLIENVKKEIQEVISTFIHSPLIKVDANERVYVGNEDHYIIEEVIPSKYKFYRLYEDIQSDPDTVTNILKRHLEEIIKLDCDFFSAHDEDFVQLIGLCKKIYKKYTTFDSD